MRGFLRPAVKPTASDKQEAFAALARGKRSKLAKAVGTTLVKADQWARGGDVPAEVAKALEGAVGRLKPAAARSAAPTG